MIDTGALNAADIPGRSARNLASCFDVDGPSREEILCRWTAKRAEAPEMRRHIEAILSGPRLSGPELKQLREAYGIELAEIYVTIRINKDVMAAIEADRIEELPATIYLKQFLKSLSRILQIDSRRVIERYLEAVSAGQPEH